MKYAYFPGCSLHSTAKEYDMSVRTVCGDLGVELEEIQDWNCCGSSPAHNTNHLMSIALPARTLAKADGDELDVVAPCASCYNRLKIAREEVRKSPFLRRQVSEIIGQDYAAKSEVYSLLEVIAIHVGPEKLKKAVKKPLEGLKVAAYYGCLLVRPPEVINFDDSENPQTLDRIVAALGAEAVEWPFKNECCGASFSVTKTDVMMHMVDRILDMAKANGANCIVTACPLCHANLDMRQRQIESVYDRDYNLPTYYFTQLIGLALDKPVNSLGLQRHMVDPFRLLREAGLVS